MGSYHSWLLVAQPSLKLRRHADGRDRLSLLRKDGDTYWYSTFYPSPLCTSREEGDWRGDGYMNSHSIF